MVINCRFIQIPASAGFYLGSSDFGGKHLTGFLIHRCRKSDFMMESDFNLILTGFHEISFYCLFIRFSNLGRREYKILSFTYNIPVLTH